ncbi:tyrosine integrase [Gordonia phage RavenCo17]|nr:tyrosine integrase [Gordonia phage RavenCo17]
MASIQSRTHKDGSTTHRVIWRADGRQRSLTFVDLPSAVDFRRNVDVHGPDEAMRVLDLIDAGRREMTLAQWLTAHVDGLTGIQEGTRKRYRGYIKADLADIGTLPLSAITETTVGRWVAGLEAAKQSGKTIQNKHAFLSGALKVAVRAGKIDRNPCEGRRLPRTERGEMVFLSRAEFDQVHAAIAQPRWADLALWLVSTGMRFSEATALRAADVHFDDATCRITRAWKHTGSYGRELGPPKSRRSVRTIDLPQQALDVVQRRIDDPATGEWLFCNSVGNAATTQDFYNHAWSKARRVLIDEATGEGKKPRVHDLRHTCASWMIAAGIPLVVVSRHLGHEDITTTANTYSHVDRTSGKAAAAAIGAMLG